MAWSACWQLLQAARAWSSSLAVACPPPQVCACMHAAVRPLNLLPDSLWPGCTGGRLDAWSMVLHMHAMQMPLSLLHSRAHDLAAVVVMATHSEVQRTKILTDISLTEGMSTFSTRGGLYERAQKRFSVTDGKRLFTYAFFERQRLDAMVRITSPTFQRVEE